MIEKVRLDDCVVVQTLNPTLIHLTPGPCHLFTILPLLKRRPSLPLASRFFSPRCFFTSSDFPAMEEFSTLSPQVDSASIWFFPALSLILPFFRERWLCPPDPSSPPATVCQLVNSPYPPFSTASLWLWHEHSQLHVGANSGCTVPA